jgi:hypothetical protein
MLLTKEILKPNYLDANEVAGDDVTREQVERIFHR